MPGMVRRDKDVAGGVLIRGSPDTFVNNHRMVRRGDLVASHGISPHRGPIMIKGSKNVFANNIPACRRGDPASCGHPVTGSNNVFANGP